MPSWVLNFWKDGHSTTLMDKLCQCLTRLIVKKVVFCVQMAFHVWFVSIHLSLGTTESLSPFFSFSPIRYIRYTLMRSPSLSFLSSKLNSSSSPSLSSQERCSSITLISGALHSRMSMPLLCWGALNWTKHSRRGFPTTKQRGRITSLLMQLGAWLAFIFFFFFLWRHAECSCCSPGPQGSSQKSCFPTDPPSAHISAWGCYFSQPAGLGNFPYWRSNFCLQSPRFLPVHTREYFSCISRVLLMCCCHQQSATFPHKTWLMCWAGIIFASPKPAFGSAWFLLMMNASNTYPCIGNSSPVERVVNSITLPPKGD